MTLSTGARKSVNNRRGTSWHADFLAAYEECGTLTGAARAVGVDRRTVNRHRQQHEDFALAFADLEEQTTEKLEKAAITRALDGSDRLLEFLLRSRRPETYRENLKIEHSGRVGQDLSGMSDAELRALADELDQRA